VNSVIDMSLIYLSRRTGALPAVAESRSLTSTSPRVSRRWWRSRFKARARAFPETSSRELERSSVSQGYDHVVVSAEAWDSGDLQLASNDVLGATCARAQISFLRHADCPINCPNGYYAHEGVTIVNDILIWTQTSKTSQFWPTFSAHHFIPSSRRAYAVEMFSLMSLHAS
jgi:hypothetical protein